MNSVIKCFVCHVKTDDWRNELHGLKSQHSCTLVTDFMKKILGDFNLSRNIDDVQNCICADCLNRFEGMFAMILKQTFYNIFLSHTIEYDWTCTMAKQQEKELYDLLTRTDTLCNAELNGDICDRDTNTRNNKSFGGDPLIDFLDQPFHRSDELVGQDEMIKVMVEPLDVLIPQDKQSDEELQDHDIDIGAIDNQPDDPDFNVKIESDSDDDYVPQKRTTKGKRAKPQQMKNDIGDLLVPKKRGRKPKNKESTEETKPRKKREKKSYECKDCENIFNKLVDYVVCKKIDFLSENI